MQELLIFGARTTQIKGFQRQENSDVLNIGGEKLGSNSGSNDCEISTHKQTDPEASGTAWSVGAHGKSILGGIKKFRDRVYRRNKNKQAGRVENPWG